MPNGFTTIGANGFFGAKLTVDFTKCVSTLSSIGGYAFSGSAINDGVLDFSNHLKLTSIAYNGFGEITGGQVTLPKNMEVLTYGIFRNYNGSVALPAVLKQIDQQVFDNATISNTIVLPNGFTTISPNAFFGAKLTVDFSKCTESLSSIGGYAFRDSDINGRVLDFSNHLKLTSIAYNGFGGIIGGQVTLPKNMEVLTTGIFRNYSGSIVLPRVLKQIDDRAFDNATISNSIVLPNGFTTLSANAFLGAKLTVDFSQCTETLSSIGGYAFSGSVINGGVLDFSNHLKLTSIAYNGFGAIVGGQVTLPKNMEILTYGALRNYKGSVVLPPVLKQIDQQAFEGSVIKNLTLPAGVVSIGAIAFKDVNMEELVSLNPTPPALGKTVFQGMNVSTCKLTVPAESLNLYGTTDQWKEFKLGAIGMGTVKITVKNAVSGALVNGGKYKVFQQGTLVGEFDGNSTVSSLLYGTYTIEEVTPPVGYYSSEDNAQEVIINSVNDNQEVVFINKPVPSGSGAISIRTRDADIRHSLIYSKYEIYDNKNVLRGSGTVSRVPNVIDYDSIVVAPVEIASLPYGEYTIKEIAAPSVNYQLSAPQKVKLESDKLDVLFLSAVKNDGSLKVTVLDEDSNAPISTGEYVVVNWKNDLVKQATAVNGIIELTDLPYGWYIVRELKAPAGYIPNVYHNLRVEVHAWNKNATVKVYNKKGVLEKPSYPGSVDLQLTTTGVTHHYTGVRVGEYMWMNKNIKANAYTALGPITEENIEQNHKNMAMFNYHRPPREETMNMLMQPTYWAYGVTLDDFKENYGETLVNSIFRFLCDENGFTPHEGASMKENGVNNSSWRIPHAKDLLALIGMCGDGKESDVRQYLSWAHDDPNAPIVAKATNSNFLKSNNSNKNVPILNGLNYFYWFDHSAKDPNTNKFGFNWVPAGTRQKPTRFPVPIPTEHYDNRVSYFVNTGDMVTYNQATRIKSNSVPRFENGDLAFMRYDLDAAEYVARLCRPLTDEELGYKLWINQDMTAQKITLDTHEWYVNFDEKSGEEFLLEKVKHGIIDASSVRVVKTGINEPAPFGYNEMPRGFLRSQYVQFILDKANPIKTLTNIINLAADKENPGAGKDKLWVNRLVASKMKAFAIEDNEPTFEENISIYPNPVVDVLNIEGYSSVKSLSLYNSAGSLVIKQANVSSTLDMSSLPEGMYILKLQTANDTYTHKIVKK